MHVDIGIRAEVERILDEYVRAEYDLRSAAGRMVINLDRLKLRGTAARCLVCGRTRRQGRHQGEAAHGFASATAPPAARVLKTARGEPLVTVAPRRDVAQLVQGRAGARVLVFASSREWRATIAAKLGSVGRVRADLLEDAAKIRDELLPIRNRLRQLSEQLGSETTRRQFGRHECARLRQEQSDKRAREEQLAAAHYRTVRQVNYAKGVLLFALALVSCDPESQQYITRQRGTVRERIVEGISE